MNHTEAADLILSTRIEQSASGSRELDAEIVRALYPRAMIGEYAGYEDIVFHAEPLVRNKEILPFFTTSLDAALMLFDKPDIELSIGAGERPYVDISAMVPRDYEPWLVCAETPALALAAAAMRVRGL